MKIRKITVAASSAILASTLAFWGVASAQSSNNPENQAVAGTEARGAEATPPATAAGMPLTGQVLAAVVNGTAAPAALVPNQSVGATGVTDLGVGTYEVRFQQNVADCAFLGTVGLPGSLGVSPSGEITVVGRAGVPSGVFVRTSSSSGAVADRSFHLAVIC